MTFALDPDLLAATARDLLRHDLAIGAEPPPAPPDTGETSTQTIEGLDALDGRVRGFADETRALADALDLFLDRAATTDGHVASVFDLLLAGSLR